jgi:signal peptidase I
MRPRHDADHPIAISGTVPANGEYREDDSHEAAERKDSVEGILAPAVRWAWVWVRLFGILIAIFLVVRTFMMEAFRIPTSSMENTLLAGDHLLVNKAIYGSGLPRTRLRLPAFATPARGDVIVFSPPHDPGRSYVKRIVALPGDTVAMRKRRLLVNGRVRPEPWVRASGSGDIHAPAMVWQCSFTVQPGECQPTRDTWGPLVVPQGRYMVLGDNRDESEDSRYWGFVERDAIQGRPLFVYYSFDPAVAGRTRWVTAARWSRVGKVIR